MVFYFIPTKNKTVLHSIKFYVLRFISAHYVPISLYFFSFNSFYWIWYTFCVTKNFSSKRKGDSKFIDGFFSNYHLSTIINWVNVSDVKCSPDIFLRASTRQGTNLDALKVCAKLIVNRISLYLKLFNTVNYDKHTNGIIESKRFYIMLIYFGY